jgi:hypothetical protein
MDQQLIHKMAVPDEHYERIEELLKGKRNITIKDNKGQEAKFYHHTDGTLMADKWDDEKLVQQEVVKISDVPQLKKALASRPFRENLVFRLKEDFPEMSQDEIELHADVLTEANESIKKLIASGVPPMVASKLIQDVMNDKELIEQLQAEDEDGKDNSAYALANILKERERMFGNPKDPGYGDD